MIYLPSLFSIHFLLAYLHIRFVFLTGVVICRRIIHCSSKANLFRGIDNTIDLVSDIFSVIE